MEDVDHRVGDRLELGDLDVEVLDVGLLVDDGDEGALGVVHAEHLVVDQLELRAFLDCPQDRRDLEVVEEVDLEGQSAGR